MVFILKLRNTVYLPRLLFGELCGTVNMDQCFHTSDSTVGVNCVPTVTKLPTSVCHDMSP